MEGVEGVEEVSGKEGADLGRQGCHHYPEDESFQLREGRQCGVMGPDNVAL